MSYYYIDFVSASKMSLSLFHDGVFIYDVLMQINEIWFVNVQE